MNKRVLVIAAHTDDEALGCAGTISKHVDQGDEVHLLFMTNGVGARDIVGDEISQRLISGKKLLIFLIVGFWFFKATSQ